MEPEDTRELESEIEETSAAPPEPADTATEPARMSLRGGINRRTFLAAAALGSAAAALINNIESGLGGLSLGPLPAFATTGNTCGYGCTAQDVRLVGQIQLVNEPCNIAPGTSFTSTAVATASNNSGTDR